MRLFEHVGMFNLILLSLIAAGIAIRVILLFAGIDYDEAYSYLQYISQPLFIAVSKYNIPNNHILNSAVGWFSARLIGARPEHLRLVPMIVGVLCLPAFYFGLKGIFTRKVAAWTALASWMSWPMIHYSAQVRGYIYQIFFIFLAYGLFQWAASKKQPSWISFIPCSLAMALALWALPTSMYPFFFTISLWIVHQPSQWRRCLPWIFLTGVFSAALYFPAIVYVGVFGIITFPQKDPFTIQQFTDQFQLISLSLFGLPFLWCVLLVFLPAVLSSLNLKDRLMMGRKFLTFVVFIITVLATNPATINYDRLWIWIIPFVYAFAFSFLFFLLQTPRLARMPRNILAGTFFLILCSGSFLKFRGAWPARIYHSESLFLDLQQTLQAGDFFTLPQYMGTELDYWSEVYEKDQRYTRFLIGGDWTTSLYRFPASKEILQQKIGKNEFYIVEVESAPKERGSELIEQFVQAPDLQLEKLILTTKRAIIHRASLVPTKEDM